MNSSIRWGVLGYARIARNSVIPAIIQAANSEFHAIASRDPDNLAACREQFGCVKAYHSYEELLDDPDIQAVYIPLPNSLHKEWTIKAARRGKHILCEKPLALTSEDCLEMKAACHEHRVILMEAFMYRYSARIRQVREILESGVLGEIRFVSSTFGILLSDQSSIKWDPSLGGGSLYDVGCYPINFAGMVMNAEPIAVSAEFVMHGGVDSLTSAVLRYENGAIAAINSWFQAARAVGSEIVGHKGRLIVPDTFLGNAGTLTLITAEGVREYPVPASERYVLEVEDFADAVLNGRRPMLSLEETERNMRVIDKIRTLMPRCNTEA